MAELADALDLGSSGAIRAGSSPVTCTTEIFVRNIRTLYTLIPFRLIGIFICPQVVLIHSAKYLEFLIIMPIKKHSLIDWYQSASVSVSGVLISILDLSDFFRS